MVEILKAIGDLNRLKILHLLTLGQLCVCEIEVILELSQSNVSRHLTKLKSAGIISGHKEGQWIYYKIEEVFKKKHSLLYKYLLEKFATEESYARDRQGYQTYKKSSYTCQTIRQEKDVVADYIEQTMKKDRRRL